MRNLDTAPGTSSICWKELLAQVAITNVATSDLRYYPKCGIVTIIEFQVEPLYVKLQSLSLQFFRTPWYKNLFNDDRVMIDWINRVVNVA